jgi:cytochrome c553
MPGAAVAQPAPAQPIEEKAQICSACHGEAGIPQEKTTPVIWGQNEGYLYLNLRDFNKGSRKNDQMSPIAADLTKDDMKALAAYFSKKAWPKLQQPSAADDVAKKALTAIGSIGCPSCHLDQLQGDGTTARLAGQQQEYLKQTMLAFRDGSRGNNPGMSDLMKAISPDDIDAISHYAAGLQILGGTNGR